MIKKLPFLALMLFTVSAIAQKVPFLQWQKSFGGSALDKIRSIKPTTDGGYIIAGHTFSNDDNVKNNHGANDYWIIKIDADGLTEWKKNYGGSSYDYAISIQQTADTGYIVAGYTQSNDGDVTGNHGNYDYWIIKLDKKGNLKWQKTYGGSLNDFANSVQQTKDGGYIVAGSTASNDGDVTNNHGGADFWIIKLDANGNLIWQRTFGSINNDQAYSIRQTTDGGYISAGYTDVSGGSRDDYILKLDTYGNLEWQKRYGGSATDVALNIQQVKNGGYIVAGYSASNDGKATGNHGNYDYWILRLNASGTIKWQKSLGGSGNDYAYEAEQTSDGNYVIAGASESTDGDVSFNHGGVDYWVVKLDTSGQKIWQKSLGGSNNDTAYSGCVASDGGYIIGGETFSVDGNVSESSGNGDYWIAKLSPDILDDNIKVLSYKTASNCSSLNSISFKIINNTSLYKVNLYRFGIIYNSALNITGSVDFNNLPPGLYYATAKAKEVISTSSTVSVIPAPTNVNTTNINAMQVKINWTGFDCTDSYTLQYRKQGIKQWKTYDTSAFNYTLKNLIPATTYVCRVASQKSKNGTTANSKYSDSMMFTTAADFVADKMKQQNNSTVRINNNYSLTISPNPAEKYFIIHYKDDAQQSANATLYDVNGKAVWSSGLINSNALNGKYVRATSLAKGVFYLKIINEKGELIASTKIVIAN